MHQSINLHDFREAFRNYGRSNNFSYDGLEILFDGLEQYEEDTGTPVELDVIALCCDYNEADLDEINQDYQQEFADLDEAMEWLQDQTWIVGYTAETVIYQTF
jgi:hypothetical protein